MILMPRMLRRPWVLPAIVAMLIPMPVWLAGAGLVPSRLADIVMYTGAGFFGFTFADQMGRSQRRRSERRREAHDEYRRP